MSTYPKGAIRSVTELLSYSNNFIFEASRTHSHGSPTKLHFDGVIGYKAYPEGASYQFFEIRYASGDHYHKRSQLDSHLIDQGYNDWYLFASEEDALAYLA